MHNVTNRVYASTAEAAQAQKEAHDRYLAEKEADGGIIEVEAAPVCSEPVLYADQSYKLGIFNLSDDERTNYRRLREAGIGPIVARVVAAIGISAEVTEGTSTAKVCVKIEDGDWCEISESWLDRYLPRIMTELVAADPAGTLAVILAA